MPDQGGGEFPGALVGEEQARAVKLDHPAAALRDGEAVVADFLDRLLGAAG